jgi:hypothetical protein
MRKMQLRAKLKGGRMIANQSSSSVFFPLAAAFVIALLFSAIPAPAQNVQVDLSSTSALCGGQECFNIPGIFADGVVYFGINWMDGGKECTPPAGFTTCPAAYGAQQLFGPTYSPTSTTLPSLTIGGVPFTFGTVNTANCGAPGEPTCTLDVVNLTTAGVDITLPTDQQSVYSTLIMLGTAVNGHHAGQVTVTYTDSTTGVFSQTFSDWCGFGDNPNESIAVAGFERIVANGTTIGPNCNLYAYTYALDFTKSVQSITLTDEDDSGSMFGLAITLKPPTYTIEGGAANPTSVTAGSTSTATVTVEPQPGYTGTVTLSCSISPTIVTSPSATAPSCSVSPASVTVTTGETSAPTTTLTFTSAAPAASSMSQPSSRIFYALWLPVPGLALAGLSFGSRRSRRRRLLRLLLLGLLLTGVVVTPACVSTVHLGNVGTPPGQYTVTLTGVDGNMLSQASNAAGTTNTVTVTVTDN